MLKTGSQIIPVDTGLPLPNSDLPRQLRAEGIDPAEVTLVIISHSHMDHIGGLLNDEGGLTYPNARYVLWKTEWENETQENKLAGPTDKEPWVAVWKALVGHRDRVTLVGGGEEEAEIMPGICAIPAPGHTIGHMAVQIEDGGERLLHIVDAAHTIL